MSERDPMEPLDPELASLFDADREVDLMPRGARERLWEKLDASLPPDPGGDGGDGGPPADPAKPSPSAPTVPWTSIATHALALAIGAAGATLYASATQPEPEPEAPPAVAPAPEPAPAPDPAPTPMAEPPPVEAMPAEEAAQTPPRRSPTPRAERTPEESEEPPRAAPASTLAAERVGLEIARTAIGRGEHGNALDALEQHERDYPRSRVSEEREVLWIRALAGAGRRAEAEARAAAFREQHPDSLFLPAIASIGD
jgi:hypothetical protein